MQADMKFAMVPAATPSGPGAPDPICGGRQRADSADLNRDRTEIGESAQGVSRDGERARIEMRFNGPDPETR